MAPPEETPGPGARRGPWSERPLVLPPGGGWSESWWFTAAEPAGAWGLVVALVRRPHRQASSVLVALAGPGAPLLLVDEPSAPHPRLPGIEVRAEGLWCELLCEEPFEHWSVGVEAFAVALDDPAEALGGQRGDVVALGVDCGWEASGPVEALAEAVGGSGGVDGPDVAPPPGPGGPPGSARAPGGYRQACWVAGEVLVGTEARALDGPGERGHAWGPSPWPGPPPVPSPPPGFGSQPPPRGFVVSYAFAVPVLGDAGAHRPGPEPGPDGSQLWCWFGRDVAGPPGWRLGLQAP